MLMASRNVVHAAFWLLDVLVATAGLYLLLSAEFLALVQIMVYAGAVSVLVLFVIMLTLRSREDAMRSRDLSGIVAAMSAVFALAVAGTLRGISVRPGVVAPAHAPDVA